MAGRGMRVLVASAAIVAAPMAGTGTALAQGPTVETIPIEGQFEDRILSAACDVAVTTTLSGRLRIRTFDDRGGTGVESVATINLGITVAAGDDVVRLRDVGADVVAVRPDGTVLALTSGQIPFDFDGDGVPYAFTGALVVDLTTGAVLLEPTHRPDNVARICDALAA